MDVSRRVAGSLVLGVCVLLLVRTFLVEPYAVPTGSMAPVVLGRHRAAACPRCGARVVVGRESARSSHAPHRRPCCPNCGWDELGLEQAPEAAGDRILVDKSAFLWRRPRRWELVVFRLFGKTFIKRLVGLPGELIALLDGDVYLNGALARKTLEQAWQQRILVFDNDCQPPGGWQCRWEVPREQAGPHPLAGRELRLDGTGQDRSVTYRNFLLEERQCQPLADEYAYNGGEPRPRTLVHDFLVECEVEVHKGVGTLTLGLTDGQDRALAEIPIGGESRPLVLHSAARADHACAPVAPLQAGRLYHLRMAFVDRRLSLAIDGAEPVPAVDFPPTGPRPGVDRPVTLGVRGVAVAVRGFRLYRDVHYTDAGRNAVAGKVVPLEAGQYFVLGDNSPASDDSRSWSNGGAVPAASFVGRPFVVHLPTRAASWELLGRTGYAWLPDWGRVRWLP